MRAWDLATTLTIAGAAFEVLGLSAVFAELATVTRREFNAFVDAVADMTNAMQGDSGPIWLGDSDLEELFGAEREMDAAKTHQRPSAAVAPALFLPPATDRERLEALEHQITTINEHIEDAKSASNREIEALRKKLRATDVQASKQLWQSTVRQSVGAACVFVGIVLGTVGNLI